MTPSPNPAFKKVEDIGRNHVPSPEVAEAIAQRRVQSEPQKELSPGVIPLSLEEMRKMDFDPPEFIVDQLFLKNGINAISGVPESHKSFLALDAAKSLALGMPFLGTFPAQQCKTLIIDEENSYGRVLARFDALTNEKLDIGVLCGGHIKIDEPGTVEKIIEYCHAHGFGTVIFDSLSSIHSADESSNSQMAKVFEYFIRLKQANLTVFFIHHEPKSSKSNPSHASLRGAGDIWAKCDTHISLRHPDKDVNTIIATQLKNRDAERLPEFVLAVHREDDRTWFEYIGVAPEQVGLDGRTDDAIIQLLATADGELYQGQIIEALLGAQGIGGKRKIPERLNALAKTKLDCRTAEHGRRYYSVKPEQLDG
ncbi:MAG: repair protein RadA [Candidatus Saccharibacteria bacterium]|nr:repair protein RadA [Candidatus Saccharibacteria bacterium]